jgi:FolB domain-containing protein
MALVRQAVWSARMADFDVADEIEVRDLEVTTNAGVDAWGRQKEQRALITVTLTLAETFDTAAAADALDTSTVHYGKLSKNIRDRVQNDNSGWKSTSLLAHGIHEEIMMTARDTTLQARKVTVFYPKSSLLGDGVGYSCFMSPAAGAFCNVLYLQNLRIPCLVGVNSNERTAKQPVVVNLWVECVNDARTDDYASLESVVVDVGLA